MSPDLCAPQLIGLLHHQKVEPTTPEYESEPEDSHLTQEA